MKNLYAYSPEGDLTHVSSVDKNYRLVYSCPGCQGTLIPRKGKVKAHHFAHKTEGNCSYESYLHKVAKVKFYDSYSYCLKNGLPFILTWFESRICNGCQGVQDFDISCNLEDISKSSDLTKAFDIITVEKKHNGFIADVLLESSKSDKVLFIEFAVTHTCEPEKKNSGITILEFSLTSEKDLDFLSTFPPEIALEKSTSYGIKKVCKTDQFFTPQTCKKEFEAFVIFKSNKTLIRKYKICSLNRQREQDKIIYSKLNVEDSDFNSNDAYPSYREDRYESFMNQALSEGFKFKNCITCRFSVFNSNYWMDKHWFCKKLKKRIENLNDGAECDKHWMKE